MAGVAGSSLSGRGYGCEQPHLVSLWRRRWSESSDTNALAPFGLVTIAPGGAEGHGSHMSVFRWSQTANYGSVPNRVMPNVFLAQA